MILDSINYENNFVKTIKKITRPCISTCVFGDINIDTKRDDLWHKEVCQKLRLKPYFPLQQKPRYTLMEELISLRFKVIIIAVDKNYLGSSFLGKQIDLDLIKIFEKKGIDVCGENAEYHSVAVDGPIFSKTLSIQEKKICENKNYLYLDFDISYKI